MDISFQLPVLRNVWNERSEGRITQSFFLLPSIITNVITNSEVRRRIQVIKGKIKCGFYCQVAVYSMFGGSDALP